MKGFWAGEWLLGLGLGKLLWLKSRVGAGRGARVRQWHEGGGPQGVLESGKRDWCKTHSEVERKELCLWWHGDMPSMSLSRKDLSCCGECCEPFQTTSPRAHSSRDWGGATVTHWTRGDFTGWCSSPVPCGPGKFSVHLCHSSTFLSSQYYLDLLPPPGGIPRVSVPYLRCLGPEVFHICSFFFFFFRFRNGCIWDTLGTVPKYKHKIYLCFIHTLSESDFMQHF